LDFFAVLFLVLATFDFVAVACGPPCNGTRG
jgi:hypothetical protein